MDATFLPDDAEALPLALAMARNLRQWTVRGAAAAGVRPHVRPASTYLYTPWAGGGAVITFRTTEGVDFAGELQPAVEFLGSKRPARGVRVWALDSLCPPALEAALDSLGFRESPAAEWMARPIAAAAPAGEAPMPGLTIEASADRHVWEKFPHPYHTGLAWREVADRMHLAAALRPRQIWHLLAWLDGRPVGHGTLNVTTGAPGVAGLYDIGVLPDARGRGIGRALTAALLRLASGLGCGQAVLVATEMGAPVYRRVGFTARGVVRTWQLER